MACLNIRHSASSGWRYRPLPSYSRTAPAQRPGATGGWHRPCVVAIVPTRAPSRAASSGLSWPSRHGSIMAIWKSCLTDSRLLTTWMRSFSAAGKSPGINSGVCAQHQGLVTGGQYGRQLVHQGAGGGRRAQNRAPCGKAQGIALAPSGLARRWCCPARWCARIPAPAAAPCRGPCIFAHTVSASERGRCLALVLRAGRRIALQAFQVQGAARLRTGARFAFAAERLHADDGADDVTVHINIAHVRALGDEGYGFIDARMDAQGQAVTACR